MSVPNSNAGQRTTAEASPVSTSRSARPWSSTTVSPPGRRRVPPAWSPATRARGASVLAAPVVSRPALGLVRGVCDEVVYVAAPDPFYAVGEWYEDFSQTTDDEVIGLLRRAADQSPDARAH